MVRVETQNNYCNTASKWSVRDASGAIQSNADKGYVLTDEDESERAYDPWNSDTW